MKRKVLLIGWDSADWKLINPLLDHGLMPALAQLVEQGVIGNLATLRPTLSPILWNTIATGKRGHEHGILGFTEPDENTGQIRPVSSSSRRVKALWNILSEQGLKTHVVSWFAGHPAEAVNGVCVSPLFASPARQGPLPPGSIYPPELAGEIDSLRIAPRQIGPQEILPFIPRAREIDQSKDRKLAALQRILAECCSVHNAATWILQNQEWDFLAVYYNALDAIGHKFMPFHPPRQQQVAERDFEIYKDVVAAAYRFHDMMLETLLAMAGPDATVLILSDHGFYSDHLRPQTESPVAWHRQHGIIAARGPGLRHDQRLYGASLLDIAPTILSLYGLPAGDDMPGRPLAALFEEPPVLHSIPTWEDEVSVRKTHEPLAPETAKALVEQFIALGYMEPLTGDQTVNLDRTIANNRLSLAVDLLDAGKTAEAVPILEDLRTALPEQTNLLLARTYLRLNRREDAAVLIQDMPVTPETAHLLASVRFRQGREAEALDLLTSASEAASPQIHCSIGNILMRRRRWREALDAFTRALEIDGDSSRAHLGAAAACLKLRRYEAAADHALSGVGLQHHAPRGHYMLGVALARLSHWQRAEVALRTALIMVPGMKPARRILAAVLRRKTAAALQG